MSLISIPTDNLYKFIAISGLVLIVSVMFFAETQVSSIEKLIINHKTQSKLLDIETSFLQEKVASLKDEVTYIGESKSLNTPSEKVDAINRENEENSFELKQLKITRAKFEGEVAATEYLNNKLSRLWPTLLFYFGTGHVLAILGFALWYYKIQRFEDQKMSGVDTRRKRT